MLCADLAAGPHDASGKRQNDASNRSHRLDGSLRRLEGRILILCQDQEVAAADRLLDPEGLLDEEFSVHHRNPPVPVTVEELARLIAVAEMAQQPADGDALGRRDEAVETGRRRAGEHRLADSIDHTLTEPIDVEAKHQDAHTRAAIRRVVRRQLSLDACFDLAPNHRRGEAGHGPGGCARPLRRAGGDEHARRTHVERFGERIDDRDTVADDVFPGHASRQSDLLFQRFSIRYSRRVDRYMCRQPRRAAPSAR
jgi:hypothetical protein